MRTAGSIVAVALLASTAAQAGDAVLPARAVPVAATSNDATVAWQPAPYPADWDKRIGDDFWTRLINYYALEWGHDGPPPDPTAPAGRRAGWPPAPQSTPPYPFTEWPYGGATSIGVTRPNSVDSPLMVALANTEFGKALNAAHVQIYGWINVGGNVSTNTVKPGGNWPAAYMYTPNTAQLDQAVVYFERLPDTVQTDHIDWGFRVSALYGENYRYTTAYGLASYQLLNHNLVNGYDLPMVYGEVYVPWVSDGLLLRFGRFISLPDIEAQTQQFDVLALAGLYLRQLHQHRLAGHAGPQQELVRATGRHRRHRSDAVARRPDDSQPVPESGVPGHHHAQGSRCQALHHRRHPLAERQRPRQHLRRR